MLHAESLRIVVGEKGLSNGEVELKARNGSNGPKGETVPVAEAGPRAITLLKTL